MADPRETNSGAIRPREIDFTRGTFWETAPGQTAREIVAQKGLRGMFSIKDTDSALELEPGNFVYDLIHANVFRGTRKDRYPLGVEHVVLGGFLLRFSEQHCMLQQSVSQLGDMVEGSDLERFLNNPNYLRYYPPINYEGNIFKPDSPWKRIPLESLSKRVD